MTAPVSRWDNELVQGMALTADGVHAHQMERVDALRKRQAEYLASLPVEPKAAIRAALDKMHPDGWSYPVGFEEALHLSKALRPMIQHLDTSTPGPDRDALLWIADRIRAGLEDAERSLDQIAGILQQPLRLPDEARGG